MKRIWVAVVKVDANQILEVKAPLPICVEALSRTLASVDPLLYESSFVEVTLKPY